MAYIVMAYMQVAMMASAGAEFWDFAGDAWLFHQVMAAPPQVCERLGHAPKVAKNRVAPPSRSVSGWGRPRSRCGSFSSARRRWCRWLAFISRCPFNRFAMNFRLKSCPDTFHGHRVGALSKAPLEPIRSSMVKRGEYKAPSGSRQTCRRRCRHGATIWLSCQSSIQAITT